MISPIVKKQYIEALNIIVKNYKLDKISGNYEFEIDDNLLFGVLTTSANTLGSDTKKTISISSQTVYVLGFQKSAKGGTRDIIIQLAHEFIHVYQLTSELMTDKNEREFLAYHFTLFPNNSLLQKREMNNPDFDWNVIFENVTDISRKDAIDQALRYYKALPEKKQTEYQKLHKEILDLKTQIEEKEKKEAAEKEKETKPEQQNDSTQQDEEAPR